MTKVFIDGSAGTTGLRIYERLGTRSDLELMILPDALRKDPAARAEMLNSADIAFLCLPDQAAREAVFDACDTVTMCLQVFTGMVATMTANTANMKLAAQKGFINATDLADYLVKKGMPFRSAYKISGQLVALCIQNNTVLEDLPLETYKTYSDLFDEELFEAIDLMNCVQKRISQGGTSVQSVEAQIKYVKQTILGGNEK